MNRTANTDHPIHDLLAQRWSPYAIDPARDVSENDLASLFEAARWTMSSYNAQPWRYIVAAKSRRPNIWQQIHDCLVPGNQPWAVNAPVLAVGLAAPNFEHNGKLNKAYAHDLGAASAMLTVEATARGLSVHQMIGIDPGAISREFELDDTFEPLTALAIGYLGADGVVDEQFAARQQGQRQRLPQADLILQGGL